MMRFSPPTEITPEPTPEFVLNYDASCLPSVTAPANIIESGNGESLNLVAIPPMEGEFALIETGTMQQSQSNITFLTVDTDMEDTSFLRARCTDAEYDCSLHGAVYHARIRYPQEFVIIIPNGTYRVSQSLYIIGNMHLVASNYYDGARYPGVVIQSRSNNFYLMGIDSYGLGDGMSHVRLYNIAIENRESAYHSLKITNSRVGIYHSRFVNLRNHNMGGAIVWHDSSNRASDITIANTLFENTYGHVGGGIIAKDTTGSLSLACVTFKDNEASTRGGAIGTDYFDGTMSIFKSNFINNRSQSGGAVHRVSGSSIITFEQTYWSPSYNGNPTTPNSIINAETGGITMGTSVPVPNTFNCQVPPPPSPPNSDVCSALTRTPNDNSSGFGFWTKPKGEQGATRSFSIRPNEPVTVDATTGTWYRVTYNGQVGWMINYALEAQEANCFGQLPLITSDGEERNAQYDYILNDMVPTEDWLAETCLAGIPRTDYPTKDAWEAALNENRLKCGKRIYFIYYTIFNQIFQRPPQMSDILATTYQNELLLSANSGITGIGVRENHPASQIAQDALMGHYWAILEQYCLTYPDCDNKLATENGVIGRYIWTLQAWFKDAISLTSWYETVRDAGTLSSITDISGLPTRSPLRLLIPNNIGREAAIFALSQHPNTINRVIPFQWANFAYGDPDSDAYQALVDAVQSGEFVNDGVVFCNVNLHYTRTSNRAREDVFFITTQTSFRGYDSSTYQEHFARPDWSFSETYLANNFRGSETYLACPCTNTRCNRVR